MKAITFSVVALLSMVSGMGTALAANKDFPTKVIELVVPFPPGGGADAVGRILAHKMSEELGGQIVILNKPGAAGTIGTAFVASASPDGYTMLLGQVNSNAIAPNVYKTLPFNASADFAAVGYIGFSPTVLVAKPKLGVKTAAELVALAKEKPGSLFYASDGNGAVAHVAGEMFKQLTDTEITHVPYKGSGPAVTDLVAGNVDIGFFTLPALLPMIESDRLTALAIATPQRHPKLPDVPTFAEIGLEAFKVTNWYGLLVPASTPGSVISKLNSSLNSAINDPKVAARLGEVGIDAGPTGSADAFAKMMNAELSHYATVVQAAKIAID